MFDLTIHIFFQLTAVLVKFDRELRNREDIFTGFWWFLCLIWRLQKETAGRVESTLSVLSFRINTSIYPCVWWVLCSIWRIHKRQSGKHSWFASIWRHLAEPGPVRGSGCPFPPPRSWLVDRSAQAQLHLHPAFVALPCAVLTPTEDTGEGPTRTVVLRLDPRVGLYARIPGEQRTLCVAYRRRHGMDHLQRPNKKEEHMAWIIYRSVTNNYWSSHCAFKIHVHILICARWKTMCT
jgi:hypothetical protein